MTKKKLLLVLSVSAIIIITAVGTVVFKDKQYAFVSLAIAVCSCIPFFIGFEKKEKNGSKMIIIAVMVALSVVGRLLFAALPGFKPVTAIVVIAAMYLGSEAGFMTGALTALISNFYFGQGPWTPVQMLVWGLIGLAAGLLAKPLKKSKILLAVYGALSGVIFSLLMDVWTVLWWENAFNLTRYIAAVASSAGFMAVYAISNVIFLLLLAKPIGKKLDRIQTKYGL